MRVLIAALIVTVLAMFGSVASADIPEDCFGIVDVSNMSDWNKANRHCSGGNDSVDRASDDRGNDQGDEGDDGDKPCPGKSCDDHGKPGKGKGDKNHDHDGPPGQNK